MDGVIQVLANRYLLEQVNLDYIDGPVINNTHGFHYKNHFRNMLIQLVGLINVEKLESDLDENKFNIMRSTLGSLKQCRDLQAHTHIKGTTQRIDAPSLTQNRFQQIYEGLKDIESCARKMKL